MSLPDSQFKIICRLICYVRLNNNQYFDKFKEYIVYYINYEEATNIISRLASMKIVYQSQDLSAYYQSILTILCRVFI